MSASTFKEFWTLRQDGKVLTTDNGGDVARSNACFFISIFDGLKHLTEFKNRFGVTNIDSLCKLAGWTGDINTVFDESIKSHNDAALTLANMFDATFIIYHIGFTKVGFMETGHYLAEPEYIGTGSSLVIPIAKFTAHFEFIVKTDDFDIEITDNYKKRLWKYSPGRHDPDGVWSFDDIDPKITDKPKLIAPNRLIDAWDNVDMKNTDKPVINKPLTMLYSPLVRPISRPCYINTFDGPRFSLFGKKSSINMFNDNLLNLI